MERFLIIAASIAGALALAAPTTTSEFPREASAARAQGTADADTAALGNDTTDEKGDGTGSPGDAASDAATNAPTTPPQEAEDAAKAGTSDTEAGGGEAGSSFGDFIDSIARDAKSIFNAVFGGEETTEDAR